MRLVAVDLGASGGRALACSLQEGPGGPRLTMEEAHRFAHEPIYLPRDGGRTLHWDALRLWQEVLAGLRRAAHAHGAPASIGVDTWGVDFGLLDRHGALLGNPLCYRDEITAGMVDAAWREVGREEIFRRTGIQFMPLNTLYQLMGLQRHGSPLLPLADTLLMMPDLFHYWLGGERAAEYTIASTSQMLHATTRDWDRDLLTRLGLPHLCLPRVVEPGTRLGTLRPLVAEETGLPASVAITCPASHDTASAVVATPGSGDDWAFLSAGTWCLFGAVSPRPVLDPAVLAAGFGNEGGVGGTVRLLRNITGLWLVQECRRHWAREGTDYAWSELARLAEAAPPFLALVDPDDPAFAQPTRMPHAIAEYCARTGQRAPSAPGEFVRVALEGIALAVRRRRDQLARLLGRELRVLHVVGGGTKNTLLCRFLADALACPVLAGPTEATALGNALVQAVGAGALDYRAARAVVRRSVELVEYPAGERGAWDDAFGRFLRLVGE
jgi:rhamnulokinase